LTLVVLTYDIRPGLDRDEYEQWLRDVDCPFWNDRPGIARYENWKVAENKIGDSGFPYFDLIWLKEGATFEEVYGEPAAAEFATNWVKRWGIDPDAEDPTVNYKGLTAALVAGPQHTSIPA
jgi:hypothetical protein